MVPTPMSAPVDTGKPFEDSILQPDEGVPPRLKAVVFYGEFDSAIKAKGLLGRAVRRANWDGEVEEVFWRFDLMSEPAISREALYRAVDADMILLVARGMAHPPAWLMEWLEVWAKTRRIRDAILVAWCMGRHGARLSKGAERLRAFARDQGLGWLCAEEIAAGSG